MRGTADGGQQWGQTRLTPMALRPLLQSLSACAMSQSEHKTNTFIDFA